jgi:Enoyl-(Acyl carrier protein) reductase
VFTSSGSAFAGEPQRPSYAMAKSGLGARVRHIASRWGKQGVRANAVAPGLVQTESNLAYLEEEDTLGAILQTIRAPRVGRPADIAAMVAFLASEDGEWIIGQVIAVDGGSTVPNFEVMTTLAFVAAVTERVKIVTAVAVPERPVSRAGCRRAPSSRWWRPTESR